MQTPLQTAPASIGKTKRRKWLGLLALGLLALGLSPLAGVAAAKPGHWVGLGSGHFGAYQWSVETKRPSSGPQSLRRPCLLVGTKWELGRYSYRRSRSRQCADAPGLSASGPPLIASEIQPSSQKPEITAVGMIFAAAVRKVRVTFSDGSKSTIGLDLMKPGQARSAGLGQLRYAALAVRGRWCPDRLESENAAGKILWDSGSGSYACAYEGSPATDPRL